MKTRFFLAMAAVAVFAVSANADITVTEYNGPVDVSGYVGSLSPVDGDAYFVSPGIGGAGGFALSGVGIVDSVIDNGSEVVGTTLGGTDQDIVSSDAFTDLGGGNFQLTLSISSSEDLSPGGFTVGGVTADTAGLFLGGNAGADPVEMLDHTVTLATIELLDASGASLGGPFDITSFANFTAGAGGGWDGSLGVTFGAGSSGVGIASYELVVQGTKAAIPEPTSIAILSVCGLGLVSRRRR